MGDFYKGINFGYYARNGYFSSPEALAEVDAMADHNVEWVCLIVTVMQEQFSSTRMFRDYYHTPGDDEIVDIIDALHQRNIKVMLRPMLECWDGTQRSQIVFPDDGEIIPGRPFTYWRDWFGHYTELTRHYLRIASRRGCDAYCFDSELNRMIAKSSYWLKVIECARSLYQGPLTTSMINTENSIDQLQNKNHWFYALDSVGTSMYHPTSETGGGNVDDMAAYLKPHVEKCRAFAQAYGKDFYFGETSCSAMKNASRRPAFWANGGGYDGEEQANYLRAVIKAFSAEPWWKGLFWWKWDEQNFRPQFHDDPAGDKGFTIKGKPAAQVFKNWHY